MAIFLYFSMVTICHLGFVIVFITVQNFSGIDAVVSIIQLLIFSEFGLKMPIHAPRMEVLEHYIL